MRHNRLTASGRRLCFSVTVAYGLPLHEGVISALSLNDFVDTTYGSLHCVKEKMFKINCLIVLAAALLWTHSITSGDLP